MSKASQEGTRRIVLGVFDKVKDVASATKKAFTTTKPKQKPYMENKRQQQSREEYNKSIAGRNKEIRARQAVAAGAIGAGTVMRLTRDKPELSTAAPAPAASERTSVPVAEAPKRSALDWRSRTPSTASGKAYASESKSKLKGLFSKGTSSKEVSYSDVRRGRATAMQEMKARRKEMRMDKQAKRIESEMSKAPSRKPAKSVMDFKPNLAETSNYFESFAKAPTERAEIETSSYQPRPGTRMGIGKYESKSKAMEPAKAPTAVPSSKPVRSDYPSTTAYMAAYRAYEQSRRGKRN
jgi:hypothetical protein